MNYLIQRGKVRGQVINVPDGLPELLSDITREALRCQPTKDCLCQFIIDYLHSLIVAREKARVAKGAIDRALRKVDEIITDMCICDITKEKADDMAMVMEECFKRFLEKRRCERGKPKEIIRFDEEDMLDELIQKCKFSEDDLKISRPMIEEAYNRFVQTYMAANENTDGTEALYQYFREREIKRWEEKIRNEAATKIQASFRGHIVRRSMIEKMLPKLPRNYKIGLLGDVPSELFTEMNKAARVIQKFFKEHFPSFMKEESEEYEEQEPSSICSHHSQETVIGEPYSATAPDERPVEIPEAEPMEPTEMAEEAVPVEAEIEAVGADDSALVEETAAEPVTEPVVEPESAPEQAPEPQPEAEPVPDVPPEAEASAEKEPVPEETTPAGDVPSEGAPAEETPAEPPAE